MEAAVLGSGDHSGPVQGEAPLPDVINSFICVDKYRWHQYTNFFFQKLCIKIKYHT